MYFHLLSRKLGLDAGSSALSLPEMFRTWGRKMNREVSEPRDRVRGGLVQTASTSQPDLSRLKTLTPLTSSIMIPPHFLNNMKERDKQWNFIWLYGLFIKTKTQIDIYSPLSKLQGHPTNLQAFYSLLQDWRTAGPSASYPFYFVGPKESNTAEDWKSPGRWAICRPLILFCRAERIPTADLLCKFSILLHRTKKVQTAGGWKVQAAEPPQVFYSLVQGWTIPTAAPLCKFSILLHRTEQRPILQRTGKVQAAESSASLSILSCRTEQVQNADFL